MGGPKYPNFLTFEVVFTSPSFYFIFTLYTAFTFYIDIFGFFLGFKIVHVGCES